MRVLMPRLVCAAIFALVSVVSGFSRTVIAQQSSWPQFRADPQLTGVSATALPPALKVLWTFDAGEASVLTDLPIAVAAETVRITRPPIDCGTAIPLRS